MTPVLRSATTPPSRICDSWDKNDSRPEKRQAQKRFAGMTTRFRRLPLAYRNFVGLTWTVGRGHSHPPGLFAPLGEMSYLDRMVDLRTACMHYDRLPSLPPFTAHYLHCDTAFGSAAVCELFSATFANTLITPRSKWEAADGRNYRLWS